MEKEKQIDELTTNMLQYKLRHSDLIRASRQLANQLKSIQEEIVKLENGLLEIENQKKEQDNLKKNTAIKQEQENKDIEAMRVVEDSAVGIAKEEKNNEVIK